MKRNLLVLASSAAMLLYPCLPGENLDQKIIFLFLPIAIMSKKDTIPYYHKKALPESGRAFL